MSRDPLDDYNKISLVQADQLGKAHTALSFCGKHLDDLNCGINALDKRLDEFDQMADECRAMVQSFPPDASHELSPELIDISCLESLMNPSSSPYFDRSSFDEMLSLIHI